MQMFVSDNIWGATRWLSITFTIRFKPSAVTRAPPVAMQYEVNNWLVVMGDAPERFV